MLKRIMLATIMMGASAPAFAADYYIVRGPDKKCKVVESRPTDKSVTILGDKYMTRDEADRQVLVVCKEKM